MTHDAQPLWSEFQPLPPEPDPPKRTGRMRKVLMWSISCVSVLLAFVVGVAAAGIPIDPTTTDEYKSLESALVQAVEDLDLAAIDIEDLKEERDDAISNAETATSEAEELQAAVVVREEAVAEKENDVSEREDAVADKEIEVSEREEEAKELHETAESALVALETRESDVQVLEADLDERERVVAAREDAVEQSNAAGTAPAASSASQGTSVNRPFRNCTEAREAGAAPVYRGDPGYGPHLDRDNDGIGCE